jgi:hypothetical protein
LTHLTAQRLDELAERVATHLEIAILVERRTSGREQHHRFRRSGSFRVSGRRRNRLVERSVNLMRHFAVKSCGKLVCGLADQISLADARKEFAQGFDPTGLGFAAGDPENITEASKSLGR